MIDSLPARGRPFALLLAVLIVGGAAWCIGEPIWQLLVDGPFSWHVARPQTWQGGIEVLVLAALLAAVAGLLKSPRWRLLLTLALAELYLRRHYVDLPLLVDVLYLELLVGLGAAAARVAGLPPARTNLDYLRFAVAGIVLWSIGAWTLSAFGVGSLKAMRVYTLLLAIPVLVMRPMPLCVFLWRRIGALDAAQRAGVAVLAAWLLCLMARTNADSGYDAWWYGLRGEYVLVAGGSVFTSLGLVAPVHYYPKLYELLLIPVSALGDVSVIIGISILMLALFALTCMEALKRLELPFGVRLLLTALCMTLPAVANSALTPKPDLFSGWLLLLACVTAVRFARDGSWADGAWTLLLCALACASKLTAPPYVIALLSATIVVRWRQRPMPAAETPQSLRFAVSMLALGIAVTALVTWRTWALAGVPLVGPQQVVEMFAKLGMTLKPPVGLLTARPSQWNDVPLLLTDLLFRPQRLLHIVTSWIGNVWLYLFALAFAARWLRTDRPAPGHVAASPIWWTVLIVGLLLLVTFRTGARGGDGGYFLLPMSLAILLGGFAAFTRVPAGWPRRLMLGVLPAFALFQASYSFTSANWATGTRAFDLDFGRSVRDAKLDRRRTFDIAGISEIAEYLRKAPGAARAVGYVRHAAAFRLQTTFEHLAFYGYWYREPLADADTFLRYLEDHRIDYLILPKPGAAPREDETVAPTVEAAARTLSADPSVRVIDDRRYVLYDLADLHAKARCATTSPASAAPAADCDRFGKDGAPSQPSRSDPADTRPD